MRAGDHCFGTLVKSITILVVYYRVGAWIPDAVVIFVIVPDMRVGGRVVIALAERVVNNCLAIVPDTIAVGIPILDAGINAQDGLRNRIA